MRTAAFTVARRGRAERGEVCQDSAWTHSAPGQAVLTVADGVGSAARSEIGSHLAVRVIGERLAADAPVRLRDVVAVIHAGREAWLRELRRNSAPASAARVTFAFAVVTPPLVALGAIGDCFGLVSRLEDAQPER